MKHKNQGKNFQAEEKQKAVSSGLSEKWIFIILLVFTFALYSNTLRHGYVLDDGLVVTLNTFTQKGLAGIKDILTHDTFVGFFGQEKNLVAGGRYRPLSLVTFAIEHDVFGESPFPRHFINVLLYALTAIVIFLLLKRLLIRTQGRYAYLTHLPFIAALIFIALPVHTEAVANVKSRDEILSLLFSVTAANFFLKYLDEGKKIVNLLFGFICFLFGLLSKENAITFSFVIPLMIWFFRKATRRDYLLIMIPVIVASGFFLMLRQLFTNTSVVKEVTDLMNNPFYGMTAAQKYATIIFTFGKYLSLMALPITLSHDYFPYQVAVHDFSSIGTIVSLVVCVAGLTVASLQLRKKTLFSFCILFFVFTFSVVSNLVFPVGTFLSERFLFMPSLAFCIMLAYVIARVPFYRLNQLPPSRKNISVADVTRNFFRTGSVQLLLLVVVGGYSVRTIARNPAWKDNATLFFTDISNSPNSAKLNNGMGGILLGQSDEEMSDEAKLNKVNRAKTYLEKAVQINPDYIEAHMLLGNAYLILANANPKEDSNYEKAFEQYRDALRINPNAKARDNLTVLTNAWKNYEREKQLLKEFIAEQPASDYLYYCLGTVYNSNEQVDSAIWEFRKAIAVNPDYSDAYHRLGMVYGKSKNLMDSCIYYVNIAAQKNPYNAEAYENLGVAYGMKHDYASAIEALNRGLQMNPNDAKLLFNLGITYMQMGQEQQGKEYMGKAFEMDPSLKQGK